MTDTSTIITANERVTDHFLYSECVCSCCERIKLVPGFFRHMEKLETMRQRLDFPIIINSGYRCRKHNADVGGVPRSWHLLFATDVRPGWSTDVDDDEYLNRLKAMYDMAEELEFGGLGRYEIFIHLDLRPERTRWRG